MTLARLGDKKQCAVPECENVFSVTHDGRARKYCSDECRREAWRSKRRRVRRILLEQPVPGQTPDTVKLGTTLLRLIEGRAMVGPELDTLRRLAGKLIEMAGPGGV